MNELKELTKTISAAVEAMRAQIERAGFKIYTPEAGTTLQGQQLEPLMTGAKHILPDAEPDGDPVGEPGVEGPAGLPETQVSDGTTGGAQTLDQVLAFGLVTKERRRKPRVTPQVEAIPGTAPMGFNFPETPGATEALRTDEIFPPAPATPEAAITASDDPAAILDKLIVEYANDRDGFCKAAHRHPGLKLRSNVAKEYYSTRRAAMHAAGTWPTAVRPKKVKTGERVAQIEDVKNPEDTLGPVSPDNPLAQAMYAAVKEQESKPIEAVIEEQKSGLTAPPDIQPLPIHKRPDLTGVSSATVAKIHSQMYKLHRTLITVEGEKFNWYLGDEGVMPGLRETLTTQNNTLFGIPVSFIPGAVGALLLPPNPEVQLKKQ